MAAQAIELCVTITAVYGGADQGFRRLARASGSLGRGDGIESVHFQVAKLETNLRKLHLEKALLSHSDPRAPPALPFAGVPFACWGRAARPVCETILLVAAKH